MSHNFQLPSGISAISLLFPLPRNAIIVHSALVVIHCIILSYILGSIGLLRERIIDEHISKADSNSHIVIEDNLLSTVSDDNPYVTMGDDVDLPGEYAADPLFMLLGVLSITAHLLIFLAQKWSYKFLLFLHFKEKKIERIEDINKSLYVFVTPLPHRGKPEIIPINKEPFSVKSDEAFIFHFQRRKFYFRQINDPTLRIGVFMIMEDLRLFTPNLLQYKPLTEDEVKNTRSVYGFNSLKVDIPPVYDLFIEQLIQPIPIFQLFSTLLWVTDDLWKFAIFKIISVLALESTTVFQRKKSLGSLASISSRVCTKVKVRRMLINDGVSTIKAMETDVEINSSDVVLYDIFILGNSVNITIPCDLLILEGSAIVSESQLSGESIPQLKDSIITEGEGNMVDIHGVHKSNVLFAGTSLLKSTGCRCLVVGTGTYSTQGDLINMIERSNVQSGDENRDTVYIISFLLVCSLFASGYVVYQKFFDLSEKLSGTETYRLIIRCIQIITSMVPQELPLQLSLSVNTALLALHTKKIICTQPHKVQTAGNVTHCFFDKTGTLTSDNLTCVGVVQINGDFLQSDDIDSQDFKRLVIEHCHSLTDLSEDDISSMDNKNKNNQIVSKGIQINNKSDNKSSFLAGDPCEISAIKYLYPHINSLAFLKDHSFKLQRRFLFTSEKQRMSVVVKDKGNLILLVKGSPEVMLPLMELMTEEERMTYNSTFISLVRRGLRVLAMGYKKLSPLSDSREKGLVPLSRGYEENDYGLTFCGFIAFHCPIRSDSSLVLKALINAKITCSMITGDAPLTAVGVSRKLGLLGNRIVLFPSINGREQEKKINVENVNLIEWTSDDRCLNLNGGKASDSLLSSDCSPMSLITIIRELTPEVIKEMSRDYALIVTGHCLSLYPSLSDCSEFISVFARVSPSQKEAIVTSLQSRGIQCLMCGDGSNDVGAIKQAGVGVALLSGFGCSNSLLKSDDENSHLDENKDLKSELEDIDPENLIDEKCKRVERREKYLAHIYSTEYNAYRKSILAEHSKILQIEIERVGFIKAMKIVAEKQREQLKSKHAELSLKYGSHTVWSDDTFSNIINNQLNNSNNETVDTIFENNSNRPTIELGDASVAGSFTSRNPSIVSVLDIMRQGRCTLLLVVQTQQVLVLESLIGAYALATTTTEGGKMTQTQMITTSLFALVASVAFAHASPSNRLSSVAPLSSFFHPAICVSVILQFLVHIIVSNMAVSISKEVMGPDALKALYDFENRRDIKMNNISGVGSWGDDVLGLAKGVPYHPNILNTVLFVIKTGQMLSVLLVNYKGHPWMKGSVENSPLVLSGTISVLLLLCVTCNMIPWLTSYLEFVPLNFYMRRTVLILLGLSTVGVFILDRLCLYIFARKIFFASTIEPLRECSTRDVRMIMKSCFKTAVVISCIISVTTNMFLLPVAYFAYTRYKKSVEDEEIRMLIAEEGRSKKI